VIGEGPTFRKKREKWGTLTYVLPARQWLLIGSYNFAFYVGVLEGFVFHRN
jgi:hypothetical protein